MAKKCLIKKPTLAEIKRHNTDAGYYFFSRSTMKFWKDRMSDFKVTCEGRKIFVERKRKARVPGARGKWRYDLS